MSIGDIVAVVVVAYTVGFASAIAVVVLLQRRFM